jgi:hypothetical protein
MSAMLGFDWWWGAKFVLAFLVVLALIWACAFAFKRFGGRALGAASGGRGRQPRLAVIDSAMVDARRQLLLIRRDNVEHLIMTGGPTDIVIEPNIVRGVPAAPAREAAPARVTPSLADTRAVPLADGGHWPLAPEAPPAPPVRAEPPMRADAPPMRAEAPPMRADAPPRPPRAAPPPPAPPPRATIDADIEAHEPDWSAPEEPAIESERPPTAEPPLRDEPMLRAVPDLEPAERPLRAARGQNTERLAGLAADLSRTFIDTELAATRPPAEPRRPPPPPVQPVLSVQPLSEAEEQNLTEMAQRLESALARPRPAAEPAPPTLRAVELPRAEPKPSRPEVVPAPAKPAAKAVPTPITTPTTAKPAFGSLEQEMASLLGRSSSGKT